MTGKYDPLEKYFRSLPIGKQDITLTFEFIEQVLDDELPPLAFGEREWWGNQKHGMTVEVVPWMDAGWMVDTVDFREKWVKFVRQ
jgi:hypothetical protein